MTRELDRRTGVKPQDITAVFVTHEHGDHVAGMAAFPNARWLASPAVAEILNRSDKLSRRFEGVVDRLFDAVEVIATPGHTDTHHSLRFDCDGLSIVVAGDAVATRDFFRERRGYFNAVDFELSARTMDHLAVMPTSSCRDTTTTSWWIALPEKQVGSWVGFYETSDAFSR